jgi:AraC-like DNA-binding protein
MTQAAIAVTHHANPPRVWDTRDVAAADAFDYYRDGICACFMPLKPELAYSARAGFRSVVRSWAMPAGALNTVSARAHDVHRTRAEIAASPEPGVYVNLQLDGICTVAQGGATVSLHPGEVGMFDADSPFVLKHSHRAGLRVASLLVPRSAISGFNASAPRRLSDHPVYGRIVTEAAHALVQAAEHQDSCSELHSLFLTLVAMCAEAPAHEPVSRSTAQRARIYSAIRTHAARSGWTLSDCAVDLGLSARQVQRLLADGEDSFSTALTRERLAMGAHLLRDSTQQHLPISDIALAVGYSDPAPFSRAFRAAYGVSPGEWRNLDRDTLP